MVANTRECRAGGLRRLAEALGHVLAPRAYSVIVIVALLCNLAVKLFHAARSGLLREYPSWIYTDIAVLLTIEAALAVIVYRRPTKAVIRGVLILAAVVCTWSVMNAGWVIRTGTQILPMELWPLIRDPLNISWIIIINLTRMPGAAAVLLVPSALALAWFLPTLARAAPPDYKAGRFRIRVILSLAVALAALGGDAAVSSLGSTPVAATGLRFNCQLRAVLAFILPEYRHVGRSDFKYATRQLPRYDEMKAKGTSQRVSHNVVIVVLEGIQYDSTSLALEQGGIAPQTGGLAGGPTPYLSTLAAQGASFTNARAVVTHTTKALFALLTGRVPSASQDISETMPVDRPYASLATILRQGLGFRTAFFQSAKGTFESRPGLVHNLGFDKFWAREDLNDPNQFIGYLGSDEFALLGPMRDWIRSRDKPFLLVVLCSVTHDPYQVPSWFGEKLRDQGERYLQTVSYTDRFLAALDVELANLHLAEDTILCVVGDHGEGFGEHQIMGHERLGFEEVLRVVLCLRAPSLVEPGTRITAPVSSMDLTPTILGLLGFDLDGMGFDGADALRPLPGDRKLYFSGWMHQGPAGFVQGDRKFIYDPDRGTVTMYWLKMDPLELAGTELSQAQAQEISDEIMAWRKATIFRPETGRHGNTELFGAWLWKDNGRVSRIKSAEGK
ncbi:MAG: LTA synthase family protein [Planctomycetes bacterium]|nr:LTA synthase family protein [Planctomycetota bacterium]